MLISAVMGWFSAPQVDLKKKYAELPTLSRVPGSAWSSAT